MINIMLFLQFKSGDDRYLLEAKNVIEIIPFVHLKKIPKAPSYVAGLLNYRGKTIPVIDVCYLMTDKKCEPKLSSRIVLTNYNKDDGQQFCIGILNEHLTETVNWDESEFSSSGVNLEDEPYLDSVATDDKGVAQRINIAKLLPEEAYEILFKGESSDD